MADLISVSSCSSAVGSLERSADTARRLPGRPACRPSRCQRRAVSRWLVSATARISINAYSDARPLAPPRPTVCARCRSARLLNPAGLWKAAIHRPCCARAMIATALVEDERAAGGCPLIEGENESRSYASSSSSRRRPMTTLATAAKTASNAPTPMNSLHCCVPFCSRPRTNADAACISRHDTTTSAALVSATRFTG